MKTPKHFWMVGVLVSGLLLAVCVQQAAPAEPQRGGIYKEVRPKGPLVFGYPPEIVKTSYMDAVPCMESLTGISKEGDNLPVLATSWEIDADAPSIKFRLRKGVKFHDGSAWNAEVAKWNLERLMAANLTGTDSFASIAIIDEHTLLIKLKQYDSTILPQLARQSGQMVSKESVEKHGIKWHWYHPVGTGPFKFKSFERDVVLKYERFDDYWGGKPYLDELHFVYIKDRMVAQAALEKGDIHTIEARAKEALELGPKGYKVIGPRYTNMDILVPDTANHGSVFRDKRVREAIEYAINREAVAKSPGIGRGLWQAANRACPEDYALGYDPDYKGRSYDPARARKLLAEAGYPKGFKTEIILEPDVNRDALVAVQRYLAEVGIDAKLNIVDVARWTEYMMKGWRNGLLHYTMGCGDPNYAGALMRYFSETSNRFGSWERPPGWEEMLKYALAATDFESNKKRTRAAVNFMSKEALLIPLWMDPIYFVSQNYVHDTGRLGLGMFFHWTPEKAWLSKK